MTFFAAFTDSIAAGTRFSLTTSDTVLISAGTTTARSDYNNLYTDAVIRATGSDDIYDIRGALVGNANGIVAGDDGTQDFYQNIIVAANGEIASYKAAGIRVNAHSSTVTNHGHIEGYSAGIAMNGKHAASYSTIENTGEIVSNDVAITRSADATEYLAINNSGLIRGQGSAIIGAEGVEKIVNDGTIEGNISLSGGNDTYDGRLGKLIGQVSGGDGNDTLLGGAEINYFLGNIGADIISGGGGGDQIDGGAGDDMIDGGDGDDILMGGTDNDALTGGSGDDQFDGGEGNDTIDGGKGNDIVDGGIGADTMAGGAGDDKYGVYDAGDVVTEKAGEGVDHVFATIAYTLEKNVENLTVVGGTDTAGTGNELANVLTGDAGNNTLKGMAGNDTLDGGKGADILDGGTGNDTYIIDGAGDTVTEAAGEGTDTVKASVSFTLSENVERLVLTGTDDIDGTGNAAANILTGNSGKNTLIGLAGNDTLDGKGGVDQMEGGIGNDTYVVDNAGDKIVELSGEGTDTVKASISHTLAANVEKLVLTGTGNLNGTGNELANTLTGNAGANILKGLAGNDVLDGGAGADRLEGGIGNDTFVIDNAGDKVVELSGEGTDTVKASVSHTLAANVDKLILAGTGNLNGTGNELANTLTGNAGANILKGMAGNDTLVGGAGADQLYGGAGKDMFVFNSVADSKTTAMDKIFDFSHAEGDRIDLHAIDANGTMADDQAFSFIGTSAFHNKVGELRFEQKSGDTLIHGDINGDGKADFTIAVDPLVTFTASDFLL